MRAWLVALTRDRAIEIAVAAALGYALAQFAQELTEIPVAALAQHMSDEFGDLDLFEASPYFLNFHVGSTVIAYGSVLAATMALPPSRG